MKRILVQLDDESHSSLRKKAYEERRSIASIIRDSVAVTLGGERAATSGKREFRFVGAGRSRQTGPLPVSEAHDAALAESVTTKRKKK